MATAPLAGIDDTISQADDVRQPDLDALVTALRREYDAADNEYGFHRDHQLLAMHYYEAKPLGNEVDGRSQVVLPDVQEAVDYMAVSVLRTFVSGDNVVEFEATNEEDAEGADEATAAINYSFMRRQDGYRILHDWCVSGLLGPGIAKTMTCEESRVVRQTADIHDPVELEGVEGEVESAVQNIDGSYRVQIKRTIRTSESREVAIPFEEFRFSPNARHEDEADYLAHCPPKTRSDLVEMGFDVDQVYELPAYSPVYDQLDMRRWQNAESSTALEYVQLCEEYARYDFDGDGIAERIKVFRVENEILRWADGTPAVETVEDQPFSVFCSFPRPHRLIGWSLADKVMDIQVNRSVVARQLLDGMYNANLPRPVVDTSGPVDENTLDDLLSPVPGSPIRAKGGAAAVAPYATNFDVAKSLNVMEWLAGERESRTGITRLNQGLDADALNKTATGTALMQAQGQQQEEFVARNLAEAFARLMAKKYRMMRAESEPFGIKIDGEYRMVDPSKWPEEINVRIRVGLGTGSKDKRIQYRMALAPILAEGIQAGKVSDRQAFNAVDGLVRDMGLGTGDDFWVDPDSPEGQQMAQQPPAPDPALIKAQSDAAASQQKAQLDAETSAQKTALAQQESEARVAIMHNEGQQKIMLESAKAESAQRLAEEKASFEAQLARETADRNYQLALIQEANRHELATRQADHQHEIAKQREASKVPQERPGGDLDK